MQSSEDAASTPISLSARMEEVLHEMETGTLTRADLMERLAERGFGFVLIFLAFPSALPVPAPGYSTPFGLLLFLFGLQMVVGRRRLWIPPSIGRKPAGGKTLRRAFALGSRFFARLERFVRPRWNWINRPAVYSILGLLVCLMAVLMILPIPLTNTLPALVIFLLGVGWCEKDGWVLAIASALGALATLLYSILIGAMVLYGPQVVENLKTLWRD